VANGITRYYPWDWSVITEGSNHFFSYSYGANSPIWISQAFPNGINIEFMSRHGFGGSSMWDVNLLGTGWAFYLWGDTSYHRGEIGWSTSGNDWGLLGASPLVANQWYEFDMTLIGGIATLYINGIYFNKVNIGEYIPIENLHDFQISWNTWGNRDIDNIQVNSVPEPATMFLLGSGLIGVGAYARRRFRKN
jgi:hypothetical protein